MGNFRPRIRDNGYRRGRDPLVLQMQCVPHLFMPAGD